MQCCKYSNRTSVIWGEKINFRRRGKGSSQRTGGPRCVFKDEEMFIEKSRRVKDILATKTSLFRVTEMRSWRTFDWGAGKHVGLPKKQIPQRTDLIFSVLGSP